MSDALLTSSFDYLLSDSDIFQSDSYSAKFDQLDAYTFDLENQIAELSLSSDFETIIL